MTIDMRTRVDGEHEAVDAGVFFEDTVPRVLREHGALVAPGATLLDLRPLTFDVDGACWTFTWRDDGASVRAGADAAAARVRLAAVDLEDLVHDLRTPIAFHAGGTLDMPAGGLDDFVGWWLVLRAALDARPLYTPGDVTFRDRDGAAMEPRRRFHVDDPPEEMAHFLEEAGYLHVAGVFAEREMAAVSDDMDRAAPDYARGDGRSWWAKTDDGDDRLVRMQGFDERSPAAAALLADERFQQLGAIPGAGHVHGTMADNRLEALIKPIGVVEGISDIPWHKDCSLGRHSYECCSLTMGISVTGAGADSGQLRVVAGSHRALVRPAVLAATPPGLPDIALPTETGDVTIHCSCTLHMAQPPVARERRVLYTGWSLPPRDPAAHQRGRAKVREVRERAPVTVSQGRRAG